jgi:serine/threonine-protein kinase
MHELLDEQRQRWRQGERPPVESYLQRQPELGSHRELVLDLIYNEIVLREEEGEQPRLEEYLQRFPQFADDLARQFEVDEALAAAPLAERPTRPDLRDTGGPTGFEVGTPFPTLPGYEILGVLGRGGMGVVYKARQIALNRLVAVKMILAGRHAGPLERGRFRIEAETVARLQHPNIVQVYDIGAQDDRPFMVLEFVQGSIIKSLGGTPLPPRQAALWLETLARAVHYAHQRGIIHRDLKPGNILLGEGGSLKITDFGMAKIVTGGAADEPQTGGILGTPSYMAPEQAEGGIGPVGPALDVYGLGAILYEFLTGHPPFEGNSPHEVLQHVRLREPVPPSRWRADVPRDLETICLRCLDKDPAQRYGSAEALAEDLQAFSAGEPIRARRAGPTDRVFRWARRRPAEAALTASGALALAGLAVGLVWSHALAAAAAAGLSLLVGVWWHSARLQRALHEMKAQQLAAERGAERQRLLLELTRRLMRAKEPHELLRLLAETTAWLVGAELATIYLVDRQREELWSEVTLDQGVGEIRLPLGVGIAGTVAVTGEPVNIPDAYADARFNPAIDKRTGHKTRNLLTVPITAADGDVVGIFQLLNKQEGPFGPEDIEILSALADSAAVAVENVMGRAPAPLSPQAGRGEQNY